MPRQTNKTRHKPSKRRAAGRKGTVDEYDYLLMSIGRLINRVEEKSTDAVPLIRHLLLATADHRDSARALQSAVKTLRSKLDGALLDAWKDRKDILDEAAESGGLVFGGDARRFEEVRSAVRPEMKVWKGVGVLAG
jgi:elongator complex protein 1